MNNLNDTLPDLMRRATDGLEPESTDLVERGMRRGVTLRRRRTALLSFTGAGAVLATAGIIIGGTQIFDRNSPAEAPVAGTSSAATNVSTAAKPATPAQTLETLRQLVPDKLKVSAPQSSDDNGLHRASVIVDDGKGASLLTVAIQTAAANNSCAGLHGSCTVQPDGSVVVSYANESIFPYEPKKNPGGVKNTVVEIFRPDGKMISLYSYNAPKEADVKHTRATPIFSVADLSKMAASKLWVVPGKHVGATKRDPKNPGTGKPAVPAGQTLQTLKQVLPSNLQFTRPKAWGGGTEGFNAASYVINDGNGLSQVDVLVMYEVPVTKCAGEGPQHCRVRSDGAVIGWSKEVPEYPAGRNVDGVVSNIVEIHYPNGRSISMTSYNAPQEKGAAHTRTKPAFTTDQLITMAGNQAWKFPGTGTK